MGVSWRALVYRAVVVALLLATCLGYGNKRLSSAPGGYTPDSADSREHECSVTNGCSLRTFLDGEAHIYIPCRYIVGEFFCHKDTKVIAENAIGSDGYPYVHSVTVRKSRGMLATNGSLVEDFDEASMDMDYLKAFLEKGQVTKKHWTSAGEALYWKGKATWRLSGRYNPDTGQTVLTDASGDIQVFVSYVDPTSDPGSKGNLTILCTSPTYGPVSDSPGYLCGTQPVDSEVKESSKHLKDAAKAVKLDTEDYIIYHVLMEQKVEQTSEYCRHSSGLLRTCRKSTKAVKTCGELLRDQRYTQCFHSNHLDPMQAFSRCLRWACRKDKDKKFCGRFKSSLELCPGDESLLKKVSKGC